MPGGFLKIALCLSVLVHGVGLVAINFVHRGVNHPTQAVVVQPIELLVATIPEIIPAALPAAASLAAANPSPATPIEPPIEPVEKKAPEPPPARPVEQPVAPLPEPLPKPVESAVPIPIAPPVIAASETAAPSAPQVFATSGPASNSISGPGSITIEGRGDSASILAQPNYRRNSGRVYPVAALRRHEEGLVIVTAIIDSRGRPKEVELKQSSGFPTLDEAAVEAVKSWEFEPARMNGRAFESRVDVPVNYKLTDPLTR